MQIYLAASPGELREAAGFQTGIAHAAYRIGGDSALLSRNLLIPAASCPGRGAGMGRGGLLLLSGRDAPEIRRPEALAGALLRECGRRDYGGVVLDFEGPPSQDRRSFAAVLGRQCAAAGRTLYLPEAYAGATLPCRVIVNTAVSGGSLEEHLRECCRAYGGAQNIALDLQRLRMAFPLPAPSGQGEPLPQETLEAWLQERQPAVFYSRDLCVRYFTCTDHGTARFVLFDDAGTLRQKLWLGRTLGVSAAFFQWPEIRDIAAGLFHRG